MDFDFIYRGETKEIDDDVRASTSGSFIRLSNGFTHYELRGSDRGQFVVLVTGFSMPYFIFDPTFDFLVGSGFRVLRYDPFGRGFSDRPHLRYNMDLFVGQLSELLNALNFKRINLLGISMGGAIAATFAVNFTECIGRLVLIDPVGSRPAPLPWIYRIGILPGVSEIILGLAGPERMIRGLASNFFDPKHIERFREQYRTQTEFHGFQRAILSTLRNRTVDGFPKVYQRLGKLDVPVLLIWGRNDQTLPLEQSRCILSTVPRAEFHVIEDCGHIPHYEKPDEVNSILADFLNK